MYEAHRFVNNLFRITIIPGFLIVLWLSGLITFGFLKLALGLSIVIFILLPIIFKYSVTLQRGILFLTFVAYPRNLDYKNPSSIGLYATRNFYVKFKDSDNEDAENIHLGVWHILPNYLAKRFSKELNLNDSIQADIQNETDIEDDQLDRIENIIKTEYPIVTKDNEKSFYERMLRIKCPIILYLHGNTASRGADHRVQLYKVLRKLNYHIITFDYRGYGDSHRIQPTEEGLVKDGLAVYKYIRNLTDSPIFLWGHSLGTGVSTELVSQIGITSIMEPKGVILESPFTNIKDEVKYHPFAKPFRSLPWFDYTIVEPMYANSLRFESDRYIYEFPQPVMILHAEDDLVIPFKLGYKLFRIALDYRKRSWGPVEFHRFNGNLGYGHKYIFRDPNLPNIIKNFIENYKNEKYLN